MGPAEKVPRGGSKRPVVLDGSWEQTRRNPLTIVIIFVLAIGSFYFLLQSLLLNGYIFLDQALGRGNTGTGSFLEQLQLIYSRYRVMILIVLAVTQFAIFLVPTLAAVRRWHSSASGGYLGLTRFSLPGVVAGVVGTVSVLLPIEWLSSQIYSLFPGLRGLGEAQNVLVVAESPFHLVLVLFAIGFTPAVCEEILFRGYLQRTLQRKMDTPWHFLLSGAIFALFHQQLLGLPALVVMGAFLGLLLYRFHSLYVTIISHLLYNTILVLLSNYPRVVPDWMLAGESFRVEVVIFSTVVFALVVYLSLKRKPFFQSLGRPGPETEDRGN